MAYPYKTNGYASQRETTSEQRYTPGRVQETLMHTPGNNLNTKNCPQREAEIIKTKENGLSTDITQFFIPLHLLAFKKALNNFLHLGCAVVKLGRIDRHCDKF